MICERMLRHVDSAVPLDPPVAEVRIVEHRNYHPNHPRQKQMLACSVLSSGVGAFKQNNALINSL